MHLTRATLNAILKVPWLRGPEATFEHNKRGAHGTERGQLAFAREGVSDGQCAEAAIMDRAADLTYAVHDLEDFYRA